MVQEMLNRGTEVTEREDLAVDLVIIRNMMKALLQRAGGEYEVSTGD